MENSHTETEQGGGQAVESVRIPPELEKMFEDLPKSGRYNLSKNWTPEEDAILLKYWPTKRHTLVAKQLGVCTNTALKRYRELVNGVD